MRNRFPAQDPGTIYLTEGGQETEVMYRHGFELPEFAMFPLLDNPAALDVMRAMYRSYLDVAVKHGCVALVGGLDYRASPDWGHKIGLTVDKLADYQQRSIDFLRDVAAPYAGELPGVMIVGCIGPRGDAYSLNKTITAEEAEAYHAFQLAGLKSAGVDLAKAMTFNNVPEAVGVARAAARANLPLEISFTLDSNHRLKSGPSLKEAIEAVDAITGDDRPDFYGINCSHPLEFSPALEPGDWIRRIRSLRPNAASMDKILLCQLGHLEEGDPVSLGALMGMMARNHPHIDMWGGCCGTWDKHLEHIAANVREVRASA